MAVAVVASALRVGLRGCGRLGRPACGLRWQSQTQEPSAYPGIVESTEEYKFVERLIPPASIPEPPRHQSYPTPSGWQPPKDPPPNLPYFIRRSRMHNVPVYTELTHGNRQMTLIRKVEGDIWVASVEVAEALVKGWLPPQVRDQIQTQQHHQEGEPGMR
uniref:Large ribosomal subunit protein mL49 n=1 Tax=Vombatus ursinus TaxID=29139 RepID=A0A4X2K194_VOMUR